MSGRAIVIAGGYGVVGRRIAADLAPDYPGRVVVAGRNLQRADEMAAAIGHGVSGRVIDVTVPSTIEAALHDAALVMSCIDQPPERPLLHAALRRGLRYTDITPHLTELGRGTAYERIDAAARASGSRVLLGAGLVPGISNVMVRAIADAIGGADTIETSLLLSAGDVTGPASFDYFLQELTMPFEEYTAGTPNPARAFTNPVVVDFPSPIGRRVARTFPFSDQVLYPLTMGARTVRTRLALDPPWLATLLSILVRTGAVRALAGERVRRAIAKRRKSRVSPDDSPFALRVDVTCRGRSGHATLSGRQQARATAASAANLIRSLLDGEVAEPGAWMPEQVIDPAFFFTRLKGQGFTPDLSQVPTR
jgi:saccharopine dehydrogenase-like NADP-dependent oxidoreductase